jgi:type I restriction enzyme S subunit
MKSEFKKFEEVCELVGGSQPSKDEFIYEQKDGYVRLIQVRDYRTDKFITYIPLDKAKRFCTKDDIMIGRYGPPIFGIFKGLEGAYNVALMKAIVNEKLCDRNYFYWFLNSDSLRKFVEYSSKRAAGQDGVRKELLDKYPVYVPPLPEQQRIVAILDECFAALEKAKANAKQNLKNAKELFESYLQGVFEKKGEGWEDCSLEKYIKLIDYRGRTPVKTESGVRLITAKNVKLGFLQLEPQEFIALDNYDSWMSRGIPNFGDVIFTTEAPLANVAQIDTTDRLAFAQRIIVMQPKKDRLDQTFLKYMLLSNPIRKKIMRSGTGATVIGIKSSLLKKIEISFPSFQEQQTIVLQLDALRAETQRLEAVYQQKLADLEELKKSILQKAFAGELTDKSIAS